MKRRTFMQNCAAAAILAAERPQPAPAAGTTPEEASKAERNKPMFADLIGTLNSVGKPTEVYDSPDGAKVLILPHGGRILGLFTPGDSRNFFWTHPALDAVETARAFYESGEWQNSGGDRTWLAPEVDVFFPDFPKQDKYWQPRQLDPGNYKLDRTGGGLRLINRLNLTLSRSKLHVELEIAKSISSALNPLRYERGAGGVEYAGYTLRTSLELVGESRNRPGQVGIWNLLQLPQGGDLLVATYSRTDPRVYFGKVAAEDLTVSDRLIRHKMRAPGAHKIGIRAVVTAGRVGYLYAVDGQYALVVRNFAVNPSGEYVDVPFTAPEDLGYSVQAYNSDASLGFFCELEYHCPAIGGGTGRTRCLDESQVWAFRGERDRIQFIAKILLSPEI